MQKTRLPAASSPQSRQGFGWSSQSCYVNRKPTCFPTIRCTGNFHAASLRTCRRAGVRQPCLYRGGFRTGRGVREAFRGRSAERFGTCTRTGLNGPKDRRRTSHAPRAGDGRPEKGRIGRPGCRRRQMGQGFPPRGVGPVEPGGTDVLSVRDGSGRRQAMHGPRPSTWRLFRFRMVVRAKTGPGRTGAPFRSVDASAS